MANRDVARASPVRDRSRIARCGLSILVRDIRSSVGVQRLRPQREHAWFRRLGLLVRVPSEGHLRSDRRVDPICTRSLAWARGAGVSRPVVQVACGGLPRGRCRLRALRYELRSRCRVGNAGTVRADHHSPDRNSHSGRDSGGSCGSFHIRAALGRLVGLRSSRRARLRMALPDRRDTAHLRNAQHRHRIPGRFRASASGVVHPGASRPAATPDGEAGTGRGRRKSRSRPARVPPVRPVRLAEGRRISRPRTPSRPGGLGPERKSPRSK